jgi:hypothetical protein
MNQTMGYKTILDVSVSHGKYNESHENVVSSFFCTNLGCPVGTYFSRDPYSKHAHAAMCKLSLPVPVGALENGKILNKTCCLRAIT